MSGALRLFVALDLPEDVRAALAKWADTVAPAGVRCVRAENLHLTMAFLGSRAPRDAGTVDAVLAQAARPVGELAVLDALWLPPRRPGVLSVALKATPALTVLHAALVEGLEEALGWQPETRPFRPHVTVGRVRRDTPIAREALPVPAPPAMTFTPPALTLYRSWTGGREARYEPLARAALASGPA